MISIFKKTALSAVLVCIVAFSAFAQGAAKKVSGTVSDALGALAGAYVIQQGTTNGVETDADGFFELNVPEGAVLEIGSIGYKTVTVTVGAGNVYDVLLETDNILLEETVVVGYGTQKKKLVTGATVEVKGEDLAKLNTTSALAAMQASTPGVQIMQTSGQPGEGFSVTIRGMGTTGSYAPLYIIDGIPGGDINSLNPGDIERIDVLKDAASCAIYGARGANGVILVTTKQAKAGKVSVTYDGTFGIQNAERMPELLNARQYMNVMDQINLNTGVPVNNWERILSPELYANIMSGKFVGTNWLQEIYKANAPTTNHAVNITGGNDRNRFAVGVSYTGQQGIFGYPKQSDYKRLTARFNGEHVLWRKDDLDIITFGENVFFTQTSKSGIGIGNQYYNDIASALMANPMLPCYTEDGKYYEYDEINATGLWNLNSYFSNPVASLAYSARGNNISKGYGLNLSAHILIQPVKGLKIKSQFNYKNNSSTYRQYTMKYRLTGYEFSNTDKVDQNASAGWNWSWENTINYVHQLNKHNFDALVGYSMEGNGYGESVGASNSTGLWLNDWKYAYVSNMTGTPSKDNVSGSTWGDSGLISVFARFNYNYDERYMLSAIVRADGSSNFARGKRWGVFPSVSAGWVISNEPWMENAKRAVSYLKLRFSWGQNGNCNVSNFQYQSTIGSGATTGYAFGYGPQSSYSTGAYADKLANENITWERSEQFDVGIDARFLNDRLSFTADWYRKMTKDWLVNAPVMGHFGANAPYINGGDVLNTGVELSLSWRDQVAKNFAYSIGANAAYNKNQVTRIANEEGILHGQANVTQGIAELYRAQVGYPIGYFWGYKTAGVFQNQQEIDEWIAAGKPTMSANPVPGDLKFVDYNGDKTLSDDDKTMIGDPNPDWTMGINIGFEFFGADISATGYGAFGHQIWRTYRRYGDSQYNNYTTEVFNYWHGEGTSNKYPRLVPGTNYNYMNNSDLFIENADYFRIQNITVGYDFSWLTKKKTSAIQKLRFYVQLQNFFTFTGYKGMDPEIGTSTTSDS